VWFEQPKRIATDSVGLLYIRPYLGLMLDEGSSIVIFPCRFLSLIYCNIQLFALPTCLYGIEEAKTDFAAICPRKKTTHNDIIPSKWTGKRKLYPVLLLRGDFYGENKENIFC
jgi:hypothetical protein